MNDEASRPTKATLTQGMQKVECRMQKFGSKPPVYPQAIWWPTGRHPEATLRPPSGYPEATTGLRVLRIWRAPAMAQKAVVYLLTT